MAGRVEEFLIACFIAGAFLVGMLTSRILGSSPAPQPLPQKHYLLTTPSLPEVVRVVGDSIAAENGCAVVRKSGVVETVLCGNVIVTLDTPTTVQGNPTPTPTPAHETYLPENKVAEEMHGRS